jgi:hypothetical protein
VTMPAAKRTTEARNELQSEFLTRLLPHDMYSFSSRMYYACGMPHKKQPIVTAWN